MRTCAAAALLLSLAAEAAAQPAPVDLGKLRLAHEIMIEQGAVDTLRRQLQTMFAGSARLTESMGGPRSSIVDAVTKRMQDDVIRLAPEIMVDVEESYARNLSEEELRAMLDWAKTPVAKSIAAKLPQITREAMASQQPRMAGLVRSAMGAAIDAVCLEHACANEDRKALEMMMQRMYPGAAPAI